jgi:hypothetical protein
LCCQRLYLIERRLIQFTVLCQGDCAGQEFNIASSERLEI